MTQETSYVIARYDYKAQGSEELNLRKNDCLLLLDDSSNWWKVRNESTNEIGFVPSNYVRKEKLVDTFKRKLKPRTSSLNANVNNGSSSTLGPSDISSRRTAQSTKPTANGSENQFNQFASLRTRSNPNDLQSISAIVKFTYKAEQTDELDLIKGESIKVLEKSDDGWWRGSNVEGCSGWFPSNYVLEEATGIFAKKAAVASENIKGTGTGFVSGSCFQNLTNCGSERQLTTTSSGRTSDVSRETSSNASSREEAAVGAVLLYNGLEFVLHVKYKSAALETVLTLFSYQSQHATELSFRKDEQLEIVEKPEHDPNWWKARNALGDVGLIPINYIKRLSSDDLKLFHPLKSSSAVATSEHKSAPTYPNPRQQSPIETTKLTSSATPANGCANPKPEFSYTGVKSDADNYVSSRRENGGGLQQNTFNHFLPNAQPQQESVELLTPQLLRMRVSGPFAQRPWYFGPLTREECDTLLSEYGQFGDFIVRDSESNPGHYSVSLKAPGRNKHFCVRIRDDLLYEIGTRHFLSLDDLILHYTRNPIYTNDKGVKLFLQKPLSCGTN